MQEHGNGLLTRLPRMALGAAGGLIVTLIMTYGAAMLMASGIAGSESATMLVGASCAAGTLAAGFYAARASSRQLLPTGLITGGMYIVLLVVIGALFFPGILPTGGAVPVCAAALAGSCAGALGAGIMPKKR